ncbi:MAG: DNA mismatch repair endonuclease MutL [Bacteroidetes bacterium]|nr:DNA mismatch repair endonuclease MutL [Bacteroidota bacterium]
MMDRIKQLPDSIANQIAAGEVVQRPASVVKELLENAIDAEATIIKLITREGGTALIQTIDNGLGMSVTDARMCWERHATSKISNADDLFKLRSFGFRGEALTSIAAIAHVEMKTRRSEDELGVLIKIEGSKVIEQSATTTQKGTQFSIKNLFYNVPARRNFLKSIPVEMRHIIDEFTRVAMPHYDIAFSLFHNDKEVFDLKPAALANRIAELMSKRNTDDFLAVNEKHDLVSVSGFVGKPESVKKTRGEQFLFVNNRFIKDAYLNHAINSAYDQLIAKDQFPMYALFLTIDPARIDVNIHPTKTEIKFDDERSVYALVKSAVKKAIGQYTAMPELEFADTNVFNPVAFLKTDAKHTNQPVIKTDKNYNPFEGQKQWRQVQTAQWHKLFDTTADSNTTNSLTNSPSVDTSEYSKLLLSQEEISIDALQIQGGYMAAVKNGVLLIIDQRAAHERILFEKYCQNLIYRSATVQQLLFPRTIELSAIDYAIAHEILEDIKDLGFDVADFGTNCLIINGVPAETIKGSEKELLEGLLENYKHNTNTFAGDKRKALAHSLAQNEAILRTKTLAKEEQTELINQLFKCEIPSVRPNGKSVFIEFSLSKITELFK